MEPGTASGSGSDSAFSRRFLNCSRTDPVAGSASLEPSRKDVSWPSLEWEGKKEKSMEMQGDMEKQNRRKEQEYIKGLKRYEQKGIPVYIDGKKPEEEDWEKIFQIQEDGGFYMSDFIGLEDGKLREIHFDKVYNH